MVKKKIMVTGDNGYIGGALVPLLIKKGYDVIGLDTYYYDNNHFLTVPVRYKKIKKDIRQITKNDLKNIEVIIHLAALSNDPLGALDKTLTEEINEYASVRLAKLAKESGVSRFIYASSCSVYGFSESGVVSEDSPVNPLTSYAESKVNTEKKLTSLADDSFTIICMRNATVYGYSPYYRNDLVVNNLLTSGLTSGKIIVYSDGTPWRPLIDIQDLSSIIIELLTVPIETNYLFINVGFDENNLQVRDIVSIIEKELSDCIVDYKNQIEHDKRSYRVSFRQLQKLLPDVTMKWSIRRSMRDLINNLRKHKYSSTDFQSKKHDRIAILKGLLSEKKITKELYWR